VIIGGGIGALFFAFGHIEQKLTMIVNRDVSSVIKNARIGRELTKVFADASRLGDSFFDQKKELGADGYRLSRTLRVLVLQEGAKSQLSEPLQQFGGALRPFIDQGTIIHKMLQQLHTSGQKLKTDIKELSDLIAKTVVLVTMEGRDVSGLNRLNLVIPWYNEMLTESDLQIVEFARKHHS